MAQSRLSPYRDTIKQLVTQGHSDGAIGARFGVCGETVRYYRRNVHRIERKVKPTIYREPETNQRNDLDKIERDWRRLLAGRRFG